MRLLSFSRFSNFFNHIVKLLSSFKLHEIVWLSCRFYWVFHAELIKVLNVQFIVRDKHLFKTLDVFWIFNLWNKFLNFCEFISSEQFWHSVANSFVVLDCIINGLLHSFECLRVSFIELPTQMVGFDITLKFCLNFYFLIFILNFNFTIIIVWLWDGTTFLNRFWFLNQLERSLNLGNVTFRQRHLFLDADQLHGPCLSSWRVNRKLSLWPLSSVTLKYGRLHHNCVGPCRHVCRAHPILWMGALVIKLSLSLFAIAIWRNFDDLEAYILTSLDDRSYVPKEIVFKL